MKTEKVVVIEDEDDIQEVISYNLLRDGFNVRATGDGEDGLQLIKRELPDIVLLDLMLPGLDGLEVCRRLKEQPQTSAIPIIMVSAKGEESDVVLGLGLGADDYVTKPFSPRELVGRVKAVLRRARVKGDDNSKERLVFGEIIVDASRHEVRVGGQFVVFTATELRLLHFLASHPGRVFTRDQLLSNVMDDSSFVDDRNIDVHIRAIRKKLGPYRDLIETIRGVGYRFKDAGE